MDRARYARVKELVLGALTRHGAARETWLAESCGGDPELLADVRDLLSQEAAAEPAVTGVMPVSALISAANDPAGEMPERIGPFTITGVLGSGGMGVVYRGRQEEPIRRDVAVKVLRTSYPTERVLERFSWERRTLARMDHPHIARILDAGADDAGRPWVALELVDGLPITTWHEETAPPLERVLDLMILVCRAVQHAHDRGILHRDLKPGNVLVRDQDGLTVPAVIDFGIAKALDETDLELTVAGQRIGTPAYMSPEQKAGQADRVDVRSDVYALGVILYEMLAGTKPPEDDAEGPTGSVPGPSALAAGAGRRRRLRGDLDRICLMAIRPEPERRFASAAALADDLERYREGRPVSATPDSLAYRARKAARRHPFGVALGVAVLVFSVAGLGFLAYHAERLEAARERAVAAEIVARREAATADRVSGFLESLFSDVDPSRGGAAEATAQELLAQGAERLLNGLGDEPEVRGRLLAVLGRVHLGLALHERGEELLLAGIESLEAVPDSGAVLLARAEAYGNLATARHDLDRMVESEPAYRRALALYRQAHDGPHADVVLALTDLATSLQAQGQLSAAEPLLEEAIAMMVALEGELDDEQKRELAWTRNILGYVRYQMGHYHEARELFETALAGQREIVGGDDYDVANTLNNLGGISRELGDLDSADGYLAAALAMVQRMFTTDHPILARAMYARGRILIERGEVAAAAALVEEGLAMNLRVLGPDHRNTIAARANLARLRQAQGRQEEAEGLYRKVVELLLANLRADHPKTVAAQAELGTYLVERGRSTEGVARLEGALAVRRAALPDSHPALNELRIDTAAGLILQRRIDEARALLDRALRHLEPTFGAQDARCLRARELRAGI